MIEVRLTVNGVPCSINADPRTTLADFVRDQLGLTGTHVGCELGVCGACTVLIDDASARACLTLVGQVHGSEVRTIEGLPSEPEHRGLLEAFRASHSFQCGFCTPGFVVAAAELLRENSAPTAEEVRAAISGNLCRCTGYQSIVDGILLAAGPAR